MDDRDGCVEAGYSRSLSCHSTSQAVEAFHASIRRTPSGAMHALDSIRPRAKQSTFKSPPPSLQKKSGSVQEANTPLGALWESSQKSSRKNHETTGGTRKSRFTGEIEPWMSPQASRLKALAEEHAQRY